MITRSHLHIKSIFKYSWKNLLYSLFCSLLALFTYIILDFDFVSIPIGVAAILGTALAIILGFRNSSAYDRWWEARKIWGGIVNESRTFTRQALTIVDPKHVPEELSEICTRVVRYQIAWVNALRLQLRDQKDIELWNREVGKYLKKHHYEKIMKLSNKVTQIAMLNGYAIKELNAHDTMDTYSYIQMDDTLTRITDLQGRAERIKGTPLPKPYDYYTLAFLNTFIVFLPFSMIHALSEVNLTLLVVPITVIVGWIFYQIYMLGKVMSTPFENWNTDVPLTAISNTIEIDLKEIIEDEVVPEKMKPKDGVLM